MADREGPKQAFRWECSGCKHYTFTKYYNQKYNASESLACHHPNYRDRGFPWRSFDNYLTSQTPSWCPVHPDKKGTK